MNHHSSWFILKAVIPLIVLWNNNKSNYGDKQERGRICLQDATVSRSHTLISANHNNRKLFVCLFVCVFCPTAVFSQGDILSGTGQTDEIETSPHWLCDYKSHRWRSDENRVNWTSISQYLVGVMYKRWTHSGYGGRWPISEWRMLDRAIAIWRG